MSTNTQQTAIQPDGKSAASASIIPTVTYDSVNRVITAEVAVSQQPGASTIAISAPPVTVPQSGKWTVVWELRVITDGLAANFADPGIVLQTLPPMVAILAGPTGTAAQWSVRLENKVPVVSSFSYDVVVKTPSLTSRKEAQMDLRSSDNNVTNDPVPVQDPLDPPMGQGR